METLDCINLICPLPVLRARKRLMALPSGAVLVVRASDPMARIDLPHFCAEAGHELVGMQTEGRITEFTIRRK